ncbi:MAG: hypothetical protein AAGA77_07710 [Bacteroidota bacterium]
MLKYYYLLLSILIISGCSLTDNDTPNPAYLVVDSVDVETNANQGGATHKITDLWVVANSELIGVFPLPARIPIIVEGETTDFFISPGFRNNGETARSFIYQLMDDEAFTLELAPGDVVERSFTFKYRDEAKFDFIEGFESPGHIFSLDLDGDENTSIEVTDEDAIVGLRSGKICLSDTNNTIQVATIFAYERAQNAGRDSYLEMDYKSDIPFIVGVIYVQEGQEITQPILAVNPREDWNKIYVDFTQILTSPVLETYRVYFTTDLPSLPVDSGEVFLDNLKFVHF